VSYILDALKKAAEQRDAHVPAMRRLFSPAPEAADSPRWRLPAVAGGAAAAGAIVAVWVLWPTPPVVTSNAATAPVVAARAEPAPAVAPETPAPPPVRTPPRPAVSEKPTIAKRPPPEPVPPVRSQQTAVDPVAAQPQPSESVTPQPQPNESVAPRPQPNESVAPRPQPSESVASRTQRTESPAPPPQAAAPPVIGAARPTPVPTVTPAPATASREAGGLRLEVIVYSEERPRRLAFINGRKYAEGDVLQDGARIQEIQPNAVVIIDDGRRVVLRP
jgi:type II secretion system (T2SS) protein B